MKGHGIGGGSFCGFMIVWSRYFCLVFGDFPLSLPKGKFTRKPLGHGS